MYKMYLISAEGYENANVHYLPQKSGKIWVSMKDVKIGMGVTNMSDLILKKYMIFVKQKILQNNRLKNIK